LNISDIPFIMRDIKNEMPYHNDNIAIIPRTFKPLPKKLMDESHKVNNKFLNNHLGEIEQAVDKKLLNKIPFIQQQKKYHEKSGILNHDNFFHCDLSTGTPISYDNFKHQSYLVNPYMVSPAACTGGDELETFPTHSVYGNFSSAYLVIMRSNTTEGVVDTCYDQIAVNSNGTDGTIRMGAYSDTSDEPDVLYAENLNSMTADYAYKSIDEFTLTSASTWFAIHIEEDNAISEGGERAGDDRWYKSTSYAAFPNPAGTGYTEGTEAQLRQLKIGHT